MSRYATAFGREPSLGLAAANPNSLLSPKFSVRMELHDEGLSELAETMREGHAGILHPLIARKTKGGLERVIGGRRQRAAKMAGLTSVPVIVKEMDDATAFEAQLIENLHHLALTDYELGRAFNHLLQEFKDRYPSQASLAKRVGKTQQWVSYQVQAYETAEQLKKDRATTRVVSPKQIEGMKEFQLRQLRNLPEDKRAETVEKLIAEKPEIKEAEPFKPIMPSGRELERKSREMREPASVKHTRAQIACPECHLTFAVVHKERAGRTEHELEQVTVA